MNQNLIENPEVEVEMVEQIVLAEQFLMDAMIALKNRGIPTEVVSAALTDLAGTLAGTQADHAVGDGLTRVYTNARDNARSRQKGEHHG